MMTPVIFKLDHDSKDRVTAFFPTIAGDMSPHTMSCYAHIGQHSTADESYVRAAKPASPDQYADLLAELRSIGYDDLKIIHRLSRYHRQAREEQLKN
jgi:hypothetical protein